MMYRKKDFSVAGRDRTRIWDIHFGVGVRSIVKKSEKLVGKFDLVLRKKDCI